MKDKQHNGQKRQIIVGKIQRYKRKTEHTNPTKNRDELGCSRMVVKSCSASGTCRVIVKDTKIV